MTTNQDLKLSSALDDVKTLNDERLLRKLSGKETPADRAAAQLFANSSYARGAEGMTNFFREANAKMLRANLPD
jgi:hypothetical protein